MSDKEVKEVTNDLLKELQSNDPFVQAFKDDGHRPQIDPNYEGMPGLPDFSKSPYTTAIEEDTLTMSNDMKSTDDYFVSDKYPTGMEHYYPFFDGVSSPAALDLTMLDTPIPLQNRTVEEVTRVNTALNKFFTTVRPDDLAIGCVMIYHGFINETEVAYIRFERDHNPMTFVLRSDSLDYFLNSWVAAATKEDRLQNIIDWCREDNNDKSMQTRGYRKRITQIALECPLEFFQQKNPSHEYDGLLNGDFDRIDMSLATFNNRFDRYIGLATRLAEKLATKIKVRDHNLVLAFKGNTTMDSLLIGLDKIPPKLPEGGEYLLGEKAIVPEEWLMYGNDAMVTVRKIMKVEQWVETLCVETKKAMPDHPFARKRFKQNMHDRLLASSHFIKEIYQLAPNDVKPYVEEVANEIMKALNNHGGNIGLDLNTWVVYQYPEDGTPAVPLVISPLNFKQTVYETHTDRFMDILYSFMLGLKSPYVRPYTRRTIVDGTDGFAIGSIRQIKD